MSRRSRGGDGQIQDGGEGRVRGGVGFGRFRDGVWLKMHHPLYLTSQINGDLKCVQKLLDPKALCVQNLVGCHQPSGVLGSWASWPSGAAQRLAELALSCTQMQEDGSHGEARPSFADVARGAKERSDLRVVRALRALHEAPAEIPPETGQRCEARQVEDGARPFRPVSSSASRERSLRAPQELNEVSPRQIPPSEPLVLELFALECVRAQGADLQRIASSKRRIAHGLTAEESAGDLLAATDRKGPLCVGRAFQTPLFEELVAKSVSGRSTISREHFQVSVDCNPRGRGGRPRFVLKNCSGNGTRLNDQILQGRGDEAPLRHGDLVTLTRFGPAAGKSEVEFIQFRFDLSRSCLEGLELPGGSREAGVGAAEPGGPSGLRDSGVPSALHAPASAGSVGIAPANVASAAGTRESRRSSGHVAAKVERSDPALFLEVLGPGVKMQLPDEQRRLAFAPVMSGEEPFSSFLIGRAHQLDFWPEVLQPDALSTLSRQHLQVQTWRAGDGRFSFVARNLSEVNPVHVVANMEACEPCVLAKGEQRHLLDGDRLVLNLGQAHAFWMTLTDLTLRVAERLTRRLPRSLQPAKDEDLISTAATPQDLQEEMNDDKEGRFLLKAAPTLKLGNMPRPTDFGREGEASPWRHWTSAWTGAGDDSGIGVLRSSRTSASFASTLQAKAFGGSSAVSQQWPSSSPRDGFPRYGFPRGVPERRSVSPEPYGGGVPRRPHEARWTHGL
ncbi:Hypothetical protein SCF082_LOCUS46313 [Durusdinium trenchii]|uniref:FHA domain-containing protein n=1 Tax=Durusdinium trenchii TaxID=1381693 RepID=A0ABP0RE36_9DINO